MGEHRLPKPPRPEAVPADGYAVDLVPMMVPKPGVFIVRRPAYTQDGDRHLVTQPDGSSVELPKDAIIVFEGDEVDPSKMDIAFVLRGVYIQRSTLVRDIQGRPKTTAHHVGITELARIGVDEFHARVKALKEHQRE